MSEFRDVHSMIHHKLELFRNDTNCKMVDDLDFAYHIMHLVH